MSTTPVTVRKAVLPVAGLGTRMLPATKAIPKEMLPVVDRPLAGSCRPGASVPLPEPAPCRIAARRPLAGKPAPALACRPPPGKQPPGRDQ